MYKLYIYIHSLCVHICVKQIYIYIHTIKYRIIFCFWQQNHDTNLGSPNLGLHPRNPVMARLGRASFWSNRPAVTDTSWLVGGINLPLVGNILLIMVNITGYYMVNDG